MTFKTGARIRETSSTTGTGTYTLDGAPSGHQAFSTLGANNLCPYFATEGANWEEGIGTVLTGPNRLARTHVLASSNAGAAVDWAGAGPRTLRCGPIGALGVPRKLSKSVAGGAGTTTLTQDEQRYNIIEFTGALTGNRIIEVDATPWECTYINSTTGDFTLVVRVAGQTGAEFYQGRASRAACDGVDVRKCADDPPPGLLLDYAAAAVISGYALACDGSNVSRTGANAALFNKIGTTWGAGDGSTTFGVPDLRRRATIGSGGTAVSGPANTVGSVGGAETHTLSTGEIPVHAHSFSGATDSQGDHVHQEQGNVTPGGAVPARRLTGTGAGAANTILSSTETNFSTDAGPLETLGGGTHAHNYSGTTGNAGSGGAHNNVQPSAVVTKMIKL